MAKRASNSESATGAAGRERARGSSLAGEIGKKRAFEVAEVEAFLNILRTASVLTTDVHRFFKKYGLTEGQYNALRILRGHGESGVASQTIGEQLVAQVPDVTRLVDRLVMAGLAARARDQADGRVVMVKITRVGLELLGRIDRPLVELHKEQLGHMTRAELKAINALMVRARRREDDVGERCP